jgi:uncharacterized membrane protein SpoIIM required for sporulation
MPRTPEQFVLARRDSWARLEDLIEKAQNSRLTSLTDSEIHELGTLYRRASADLARAQTRYSTTFAGGELVRSLNALVLRAHAQIYSAPPVQTTPFQALWEFLLYGFPATFRRHWHAIALSAMLLFLPGFGAYIAVWTNASNTRIFVEDRVVQEVESRAQKKLVTGWGGNTSYKGVVQSPEISSFITVNNIRVSLIAVALGLTAGIGTGIVLIQNGMLIGALAGAATNANVDFLFWSVILPHGVIELTAIAIAGGAGFVLARSIYAPGELPRRDALKLAGNQAAQLVAGVAAMLVIAGLIEGFITPTTLPPIFKMAFAALTGLALIFYLNLRPKTVK